MCCEHRPGKAFCLVPISFSFSPVLVFVEIIVIEGPPAGLAPSLLVKIRHEPHLFPNPFSLLPPQSGVPFDTRKGRRAEDCGRKDLR